MSALTNGSPLMRSLKFFDFKLSSLIASYEYTLPVGRMATMCECSVNSLNVIGQWYLSNDTVSNVIEIY
jgi:hypothetical protein